MFESVLVLTDEFAMENLMTTSLDPFKKRTTVQSDAMQISEMETGNN